MSATTGDNAAALITKLSKLNLDAGVVQADAKLEALQLGRKLVASLEDPSRRAIDLAFQPFDSIAARIAIELDLFKNISDRDSITSQELAEITGADEMLIGRLLRLLASQDYVSESGRDRWGATAITKALASAPIAAGHRVLFDIVIRSGIKAPKFLVETKFKCPTEPTDGILQYALRTKRGFYDYIATKNSHFHDFNLFMGHVMESREYWHQWYDIEGRLLSGYNKSFGPLLVDIGGGNGYDLQAFHEKVLNEHEGFYKKFLEKNKGILVLQDLAPVLDSISSTALHPAIKKFPHDFFTEQPTMYHGARIYLLHHILHNWNDNFCLRILKHLRAAMKPGYSRLLILDSILPNTGAMEMQTRLDLTMMTCTGSMERSRSQWEKLLEEAKFEVVGTFEREDADGLVEAIVKE